MKISNLAKDNPKLLQKVLKDGRISLYLEYYLGRETLPETDEKGNQLLYESGKMQGKPKMKVHHIRKRENLNLYLIAKPRTQDERFQNNDILEIAKKVRHEKEQELKSAREGYEFRQTKKINFFNFYNKYLATYTKKDKRKIKDVLRYFREFLEASTDYKGLTQVIRPSQITPVMIREFADYLKATHQGEGATTYFQRFKKVCANAEDKGIFAKSPCKGITISVDRGTIKKDILSIEEIKMLLSTHYPGENPDIRRAFAFSLLCGLRWCDVKDLKFENVDYQNRMLHFEQSKTKGHSANASVVIPLNDNLLHLIGEPGESRDAIIFPLPSHTMCLKALKHWTARAGITKHITWHCARHSFAVNILNNGANIKTVASLLGHSGLGHVDKYLRAVDKLKQDAINSINLDLDI